MGTSVIVPNSDVEFQSNSNVKFVLNTTTTLQSTKEEKEGFHCKIPSLLQQTLRIAYRYKHFAFKF